MKFIDSDVVIMGDTTEEWCTHVPPMLLNNTLQVLNIEFVFPSNMQQRYQS